MQNRFYIIPGKYNDLKERIILLPRQKKIDSNKWIVVVLARYFL